MFKFRSFTLIEMIIVIMIVSIMLLITLNISSNQTKELRFRIEREDFVSNYNSFIIKAITTNATDYNITFHINAPDGQQSLTTNDPTVIFEDMSQLKIDSFGSSSGVHLQTLSRNSSLGSCIVDGQHGDIIVQTSYRDAVLAPKCYTIDLSTCKLRSSPCPNSN